MIRAWLASLIGDDPDPQYSPLDLMDGLGGKGGGGLVTAVADNNPAPVNDGATVTPAGGLVHQERYDAMARQLSEATA